MAFNEDQNELSVLRQTPISFIIVGKPGCGKSSLARRLSAVWKCQLIDGTSNIEHIIKDNSQLAQQVKKTLIDGGEISEEQVASIILDKLNSPEIQHYGYVLDCLPSYDESWKTIQEQIEFLKRLPQPPNIIINLKIPDKDLLSRRLGQKIDPINNEVFTKDVYDPDEDGARKRGDGGEEEGEEDEEDEDEDDDDEDKDKDGEENTEDEFQDDLGDLDSLHLLAPNIANRLVRRPRDLSDTIQSEISHYKQHILKHIEDYIIQHNHQFVIELDANLSQKDLFRSLLVRLTALGLPRAKAPKRLVEPDQNEEEEEPEGIDTDQFLSQLRETNIIAPRFRWRRSRWSQYCPVELANGNMIKGKMQFSVGFLDKMYSLSSANALASFIRSPRTCLLPPHPQIPCKICIVGPPTSGKTTLAKSLADHYNAIVVDVHELIKPVMADALQNLIDEASEKAKEEVISRLTTEQQALRAERDDIDVDEEVHIPDDHPEVIEAIKAAVDNARDTPIETSPEMYLEAYLLGIKRAEERRRETSDGRQCGGWIIDGFPVYRDQWLLISDTNNILPDSVLSLELLEGKENVCLKRYCQMKGIPETIEQPIEPKKDEENEEEDLEEGKKKTVMHPEVLQWRKQTTEFEQQWNLLASTMVGSSVEPIKLDLTLPIEELTQKAIVGLEAVFEFKTVEYSELDEDADVDDDPVISDKDEDEEGEEEDDDDARQAMAKMRKPWGDTSFYCPVALKTQNVLWPGQIENALRYRERLYYFSSEEAKESFRDNPLEYTALDKPLEVPVHRIFLLGPKASGKTTVGRMLAKKLGIFHISFRTYLQDHIMPKMKRAPLEDPEDCEDIEEEKEEEQEVVDQEAVQDLVTGTDLDDDVAEQLDDKETELRAYLLHGESLSEETLEEFSQKFWNLDPYKLLGFIIEGLPFQVDELRYLCSKGLYPDAVAILEAEEGKVVERILPGKMDIWRKKRDRRVAKRNEAREKKLKEWEEDKNNRKAEIEEEYKQKKAQHETMIKERRDNAEDDEEEEDEGEEDPFYEEYKEQIAEIDAEDPPEEEEDEEEAEDDVEEKMRSSIVEKYEEQNEAIASIKEVLVELQVPFFKVPANRKVPVVAYSLEKSLTRFLKDRRGLLTKCSPLETSNAKRLLDHGYKQLSKFGYWCPVKLMSEPTSVLPPSSIVTTFPATYRQCIYFMSSSGARTSFMHNPDYYVDQDVPRLPVPVRLAVVGPPKSGKTTVANRFAVEYDCVRLSMGETLRKMVAQFPRSDLSEQIMSYLRAGQTVPDELCTLALERMLLDIQPTSRGYVLDGWPLTKAQVDLLNKYRIIPVCIVELNVTNEVMLERAHLMRQSPDRLYPVNDSPSSLLVNSALYHKNVKDIRDWYSQTHDNWTIVDGERNKWYMWVEAESIALRTAVQIQQYLIRITENKAASIDCLCVTREEFKGRLGPYGEYCPVSFVTKGELVDCSDQSSLKYAVEYNAKYYRTAGEDEMRGFLSNPELYIDESVCDGFPSPDCLPYKRTELEVKEMFPRQYEINGFCPVKYVDGKKRYESLVSGEPQYSIEYKGKLFCCSTEENRQKFMRFPERYCVTKLPLKLPPVKQPSSIVSLPMLGYMEQSVAVPIINSLTAVGSVKPKFPFLSSTQSALIYVALYLKAYNPKSSYYVRDVYQQKLKMFEEHCHLIAKLGKAMSNGYKEPQERPIDFEMNMNSFLSLIQSGSN